MLISDLLQLSPYLNIDPSYLNTNTPEYIFDTETKRGKLEKSFTGIGGSVCIGSGKTAFSLVELI